MRCRASLRTKIDALLTPKFQTLRVYKAQMEEKFKWPKQGDDILTLNGEQVNWLLDGYDISIMKPHRTLFYENL